ncbi:MAG: N-6 DNA methylase [Ignavibacteria bacterium]
MNQKKTGSYYTPKLITDFLINHVSLILKTKYLSILEPSAGDGVFVKSIFKHHDLYNRIKSLFAVEINRKELDKLGKEIISKRLKLINEDFLKFQKDSKKTFSLVVGNPPYIKKKFLTQKQIRLCEEIHNDSLLSNHKINNIWTAFLVRCIKFVDDIGILALILPSEFMQVKFSTELRALILKEFERVEIFTFNELLFKECKGQDTLLLICERKSINKGLFFANINKVEDLEKKNFALSKRIDIKESKWTYHHLENDEIELIQRLKDKFKTVNHYCSSKAGIVTAANDYFIVDEETVNRYSLYNYVKPIIQKGFFVNGSVLFRKKDFNDLRKESKPIYLIDLNVIDKNNQIGEYLKIGVKLGIQNRYKTSIRKNWYSIPNIQTPSDGLFFKRCHEYPKLIINKAKVYATDSAYLVTMRNGYNIQDLVFSFYNSLTLLFSELNGRFYGGGVLELTPNEFKQLPIPYATISRNEFKNYTREFSNKSSILDICNKYNYFILKSAIPKISGDDIRKIIDIKAKLFARRHKN